MEKRFGLMVGIFLLMWALPADAVAQTNSFAQQLYGVWYTYPLGNPNTDAFRREFRHNATTGKDEMIVTRRCAGSYRSVTARAVSPVEISETTIQVLKSASDGQEGEGRSQCRVTLEAGVLSYTFSEDGSRITLTNPGGNPDLLELARQDAASEAMLQSRVYGSWVLTVPGKKDSNAGTRFVFYGGPDPDKGGVRQIVSCFTGKNSLLSQVDSAVTITKEQIIILDSASHDERDADFVCTATITAATLNYEISPDGSVMTLSKAGQKPLVLTRER